MLVQLHRLVFSLRFSKAERLDLDWMEEEKARNARREAEQRTRAKAEEQMGKRPHTHTHRPAPLSENKYLLIYLNTNIH